MEAVVHELIQSTRINFPAAQIFRPPATWDVNIVIRPHYSPCLGWKSSTLPVRIGVGLQSVQLGSCILRTAQVLAAADPSGLRHDNRRPYELRSCSFALSPHPTADGSATVTQGLTSVQASVFGPREPRQRAGVAHDKASIVVEVGVVPWAQGQGQGRGRSRGDK